MPSDSLGLILAFGFLMALMNAYILSLVPVTGTAQDFHLKIELNIQGGAR